MRLRRDRCDLFGEKIERRVVGRHGDRDARALAGPCDRERRCTGAGFECDRAEPLLADIASICDEPQAQVERRADRDGWKVDGDLEPAVERAALRIPHSLGLLHIGTRLRMIGDGDAAFAQKQVEEADPAARRVAPPLDVECGAETRAERGRQQIDAGVERGTDCCVLGVGAREKVRREAVLRGAGVGMEFAIAVRVEALARTTPGVGAGATDPARIEEPLGHEPATFTAYRAPFGSGQSGQQPEEAKARRGAYGPIERRSCIPLAIATRHRVPLLSAWFGRSGQKAGRAGRVKRRRSACGPGS